MNLTQFVYNALSGQLRIDRMRAKEFLEMAERQHRARGSRGGIGQLYAGAEPGMKRPSPNILSTPEDFKQAYERIVLIRAARQMEEDFPFFEGLLKDFETCVVGNGTYLPNTGSSEADAVIRDYLEWQFDQADNSQRLDLTKIARLAVRSYKRDGECAFALIDYPDDTLKINYISGDRIGNPLVGANIGPNNYNGIITDPDNGAPAFYDIFRRLPKLNAYVFEKRIEANFLIHYYDPFRFEQYHGVTAFKNAIEHAFDMKQIMDFTKLNIKWRSAQLPYVTNEQGQPRGNGYQVQPANPVTGQPQPFTIQLNGEGVTQSFLKLGEGVMNYPNDFPNTQFRGIMEELRRDIAVGLGLPLEFCYRSETGGVVQRFYVNKAERTFDEEKRWLKRTLLNPYKNRLIKKGIEVGFLDLKKFGNLADSPVVYRGQWQLGRSVVVDYSKEVDADIRLMESGALSVEEYVTENGGDLDSIMVKNEAYTTKIFQTAQRISKDTGQDVALILPYLRKIFPNPGAGLKAAGESVTTAAPLPIGQPATKPQPIGDPQKILPR